VRAETDIVASAVADARHHADRAIEALGDAVSTDSGAWLAATVDALLAKVNAAL
jgi:hypothetical protein